MIGTDDKWGFQSFSPKPKIQLNYGTFGSKRHLAQKHRQYSIRDNMRRRDIEKKTILAPPTLSTCK